MLKVTGSIQYILIDSTIIYVVQIRHQLEILYNFTYLIESDIAKL